MWPLQEMAEVISRAHLVGFVDLTEDRFCIPSAAFSLQYIHTHVWFCMYVCAYGLANLIWYSGMGWGGVIKVHATLLFSSTSIHSFMLGCCQFCCTSIHTFMLRCCNFSCTSQSVQRARGLDGVNPHGTTLCSDGGKVYPTLWYTKRIKH